jgi:hypothetical protein
MKEDMVTYLNEDSGPMMPPASSIDASASISCIGFAKLIHWLERKSYGLRGIFDANPDMH